MDIEAFNRQLRSYLRKINSNNVRLMNQCMLPLGVTPTQLMLIFTLDHHGKMNISELSERTEMPKSNISAICGRLEENGLITRERDRTDQRIVYVMLTDRCRALTKRAKEVVGREQNRLAEKLTAAQRETVLEGMSLLDYMYRDEPGL